MAYRVAEYDNYAATGGKGDWDSGIFKIDLDSWNRFHGAVAKLIEHADFIWRGQGQGWPLKSKFDRIVKSDRDARLKDHSLAGRPCVHAFLFLKIHYMAGGARAR